MKGASQSREAPSPTFKIRWLRPLLSRATGSSRQPASLPFPADGRLQATPLAAILSLIRVPYIMGKDKDSGLANMSCFVQVLGVGTDTGCTVPSVLLFFDRQRYLFNAGEGFQRFCVEHKVKLTKINSVLATRVTTEATGGLPGMLLTMADTTAGGLLTGHGGMTVHGPPGLGTLVNAFRTFVNVKDMGLKVMEFRGGEPPAGDAAPEPARPVVKNDVVTITPVLIRPDAAAHAGTAANGTDAGGEPSAKRQRTQGDEAAPDGAGLTVPSAAIESAAACYICELADIPGKFLPQKAASLGVPRGPLYGQLQQGEEVKSVNGRTVRPADVMEPSTPGPVVIVVDCPSAAFIPSLVDGAAGMGRVAADEATRSKGKCLGRWGHGVEGYDARPMCGWFLLSSGCEWLFGRSCFKGAPHLTPATLPLGLPTESTAGDNRLGCLFLVASKVHFLLHIPSKSSLRSRRFPSPCKIPLCLYCWFKRTFPVCSACAVACVVHLTPRSVLAEPAYQSFIASFGSEAQHILVAESESSPVPVMKKSAILQAKLNALDPDLFPVPLEARDSATNRPQLPPNCMVGDNMLKYNLRPVAKRGVDKSECGEVLDIAAVHAELKENRLEALEAAAKALAAEVPKEGPGAPPVAVLSASPDDLALTFLGTGAAMPSKYRNVTGLLLDLPSRGAAMLMDCGEGSLGQMRRRLGHDGADAVLRRLSMVWISHIHADHHVGLPCLLAARTRLLGPDCSPLLVVGPRPLRRALAAYATLEPMKFQFVEAAQTEAGAGQDEAQPLPEEVSSALSAARAALGLSKLESVRVVHCAHSFGLVLESSAPEGWKVVFSGDTRPCEALVEAAKGATLLIHEATFDDSMHEEALAKRHCTTKEAVEAGVAAGAYRTLLTHFSQRYPKVPVIDDNFVDHVGIAFDLMTVRLTDLPRLPGLVPAVKVLFDEEEGLEDAEPEPQMLS